MKHKIAFVLPSLRGGGAERVILNIIRGLNEKGYDIDLVLVKAVGQFLNNVPPRVRIIDLNSKRALTSLFALTNYLNTQKPAIVFPSLPHISVVTLLARLLSRSRPIVVPIEHNTLSRSVLYADNLRGRLLPYFMRLVYARADRIVAVSVGVSKDLIETLTIDSSSVSVIYNPVITQKVITSSFDTSDHPWFNGSECPVVLGAGRLTQAKGFNVLVNAFALLRKTRPARLILIGEGPEQSNLKQLVEQHKLEADVSMPGFVSNPYVYFRQSSVFVLSSLWEGLPTVLIEALACGTRIISTDCPSGPKEILENGRWGVLVPVNDIVSLAEQMSNLLEQPKPQTNSRAWDKFTIDYSTKAYETLIREVLE